MLKVVQRIKALYSFSTKAERKKGYLVFYLSMTSIIYKV